MFDIKVATGGCRFIAVCLGSEVWDEMRVGQWTDDARWLRL